MEALYETASIRHADRSFATIGAPSRYYFLWSKLESVLSAAAIEGLSEIGQEDLAFVRACRPRLAKLLNDEDQ